MLKSIFTASALSLLAVPALAHATLEQSEAAAGTTTKITLRIPHGCDGEATETVRLSLPDGFFAAKPMPKAGWTLDVVTGPYDKDYDYYGTPMREGAKEIVWSGGHLEDGWYDEFTVRGMVAGDIAPGTTLFFPAVQHCAGGTADWTDTSGGAHAAPSLTVVAAKDEGGHTHGHMPTEFTVGDLTISGAFSRATLPNAPVGGGFFTVTNNGTADDKLISVTSDASGRVEIHEMKMEGAVMKMRELEDGLPIPAGETVELKPGGFHLMLMGLKHPLKQGETVEVTLTFETAGEITVPLTIGAPNAKGHGIDHNSMKHDQEKRP